MSNKSFLSLIPEIATPRKQRQSFRLEIKGLQATSLAKEGSRGQYRRGWSTWKHRAVATERKGPGTFSESCQGSSNDIQIRDFC